MSSSRSLSGRAPAPAADRSTARRDNDASFGGSSTSRLTNRRSGAASFTMCSNSRAPYPGLSGRTWTPAASAPITATHVSIVGSAHTATREMPPSSEATVEAATRSSRYVSVTSPTRIAGESSGLETRGRRGSAGPAVGRKLLLPPIVSPACGQRGCLFADAGRSAGCPQRTVV
jgi:hypothetical protein